MTAASGPAPTPEPASLLLLGTGVSGVFGSSSSFIKHSAVTLQWARGPRRLEWFTIAMTTTSHARTDHNRSTPTRANRKPTAF
ncbi:MAG: hypothetical protein DMG04_19765 [Acidobacteria bacterium]|nr:MAG: hypothetical protein DMG04_19765 [Acidobacteriota bacterium]PYQ92538.1 MAG: hypothetical protein DMG02_00955 [Acidobacteriota bacterium]